MFFEEEGLLPRLQEVLYFDFPVVRMSHVLHRHAALTVRLESDTTITTQGKRYRLSGENVCYFPPDTPYVRESVRDRMIVFHFTLPEGAPEEFATLSVPGFARIAELAKEAHRAFSEKKAGYYYRANACFFEILSLLREEQTVHTANRPIDEAVRYVARHLSDAELTVSAIAATAYVSEVHLRTLFHRHLGCSPKAYITRQRLAYARSLLESGFYTVEECARRAGFGDPKNFAVVMKRETGRSPSAWRRECGGT
ncbi:MAG: helix-turn-helix transcriptional regulator [Clostridia bacterium]|nr:helix-turn-helix transcriptional regulator [Clostridia bacterium]